MKYSIVVVTYNRPDALSISLPMMLAQSRAPDHVIIVDSSDDPQKNEDIVKECSQKFNKPIEYYKSTPGMTKQRNIGLKHVRNEIVLFPDDDSLLFPDAMAHIMEIYEADTERVVGGVCSAEALTMPSEIMQKAETVYTMTTGDKIRKLLGKVRYHVERNFLKDPFLVLGRIKLKKLKLPDWLDQYDAVAVEWMTGFRMSFRTEVIRELAFDETLGRYALFEDTDVSMGVLDQYLLIGARKAQIYHYKSPEKRDKGFKLGAVQVINKAYILGKRGKRNMRVIASFWIFSVYKFLQYTLTLHSKFGRERLSGYLQALLHAPRLLGAKSDTIAEQYLQVRHKLSLKD